MAVSDTPMSEAGFVASLVFEQPESASRTRTRAIETEKRAFDVLDRTNPALWTAWNFPFPDTH